MYLEGNAHATLKKRTGTMYDHQRQRAKKYGDVLSYTREELRALCQDAEVCAYCSERLKVETFSLDHRRALARGGAHDLANLAVCCPRCNGAKGALVEEEFRALLALLDQWCPRARESVLRRLWAGSGVIKCG